MRVMDCFALRRLFLSLLVYMCILSPCVTGHQEIRLKDDGYEGVVVAISDKVPQEKCNQIIHGLKTVLVQFSSELWGSSGGKASLRSATVALPKSWHTKTLTCSLMETVEAAAPPIKSHVRITTSHPVFGDAPWTQQSQGCGSHGDYISMGYNPLQTSSNETFHRTARLLVAEWTKFRWGIFEERGYEGDPLFPPYFLDPVSLDLQSNMCPRDPQRDVFCNATEHVPEAPNKHNSQCGGRAASDIILYSADFSSKRSSRNGTQEPYIPELKFIQETAPRLVIAVEDTAVMNLQRRWEFVRKAVRRIVVYDIPDGAHVALIVFNSVARTVAPLSKLESVSDVRQRLGSSLPRNPSTVPESHKCMLCGIQETLRVLDSDGGGTAGANIILVTTGAGAATHHQMDEMARLVKARGVRVTPLLYPVTERPGSATSVVNSLSTLVEASGERGSLNFCVMDEGVGNDSKVSMMVALMDALLGAVRISGPLDAPRAPVIVHSMSYTGGISSMSTGTFDLDDSYGPDARLSIYYYDLNHVGNTIQLTTPSGKVMSSVNKQEEDGDANVIFVNIPNAERGIWRYKVENRADSHQGLHVQVTAYTNVKRKLKVRLWTSTSATVLDASDPSTSIIILTEVAEAEAPVLNARVIAKLQRLGTNTSGSAYDPVYVELYDNGYGDPDITGGDGVYSRYLPQLLTFSGYYELSVSVDHNSGLALSPATDVLAIHSRLQDNSHRSCCGSAIKYDHLRPVSPFRREMTYGVLNFVNANPGRDLIPPSKILNLWASVNETTRMVTLQWNAPGGDYDWGRAQQYEAVLASSWDEARAFNGERITGLPLPLSVGTEQSLTIMGSRFGLMSYIALRAVDLAGNRGGISNVASFWLPHPPTTVPPTTSPQPSMALSGESEALGQGFTQPVRVAGFALEDVAIIVGSVGGFLVISTVLAVFCYCHVSRKRKPQPRKDSDMQEANRSVMIKTSSSIILDQDESKESVESTVKDAEVLKDNGRPLSPVQSWAASKLLAEHERRFSVTSGPVLDQQGTVVHYGANLQDPFPDVTLTGSHSYPSSQTPSTTQSDPPAYQPVFTNEGYPAYPYPYHAGYSHEDLPPYTPGLSSQSSQASTAYTHEIVPQVPGAYSVDASAYINELAVFGADGGPPFPVPPSMYGPYTEEAPQPVATNRAKVPPPVAPKPQMRSPQPSGSGEPKRRNVTQV